MSDEKKAGQCGVEGCAEHEARAGEALCPVHLREAAAKVLRYFPLTEAQVNAALDLRDIPSGD